MSSSDLGWVGLGWVGASAGLSAERCVVFMCREMCVNNSHPAMLSNIKRVYSYLKQEGNTS